jgi:DNA-binding MarR family transcriptional regulator
MDPADTMVGEIFDAVVAIVDRVAFSARNRSHLIEGERLHGSEVHLLLHIGQGGQHRRSVTRIGETFGITKGAVSQTLGRLAAKGLLTKEADGASKNELTIHLTDKGKRAHEACLAIRQHFFEEHERLLVGITHEHREALLSYLTRLRDHI